jgi:hypothetical protein
MEPTKEEKLVIELLKKAGRHWPNSLWLFAEGGQIHVMRTGQDGEHVVDDHTGGMDTSFILATINIDMTGVNGSEE